MRSEHSDEYTEPVEVAPGIFRQKVWHLQDGGRPYFVESLWRPDATFSLAQSFSTGTCYFGPPLMGLPHDPLEVGTKQSFHSFCANDSVPRREFRGSSEVVRQENLTIGGTVVTTFVIDYNVKIIDHKNGIGFFNEGTEWYSPDYRLSVKQTFKYNDIPSSNPDYEYTEELKSLTPS